MVHTTMDMKIDEGRVFGARYYTAQPEICWDPTNDWGSIDAWEKMEEWCTNIFGSVGDIWDDSDPKVLSRWYMNGAKFWFREKKDLEWFILKWQ